MVNDQNAHTDGGSSRLQSNNTAETPLLVSVGVILKRTPQQSTQVLISERRASQSLAGFWEFPGGKVEAHETAYEGLIRELNEELGIVVTQAQFMTSILHQNQNSHYWVSLQVFSVEAFTGEAVGREGQQIRWVAAELLSTYSFPDADAPLIEMIKQNNR